MEKLITNENRKKVRFISADYGLVRTIPVEAKTNEEAIEKAIESYNANYWDFHYCEIEVVTVYKVYR